MPFTILLREKIWFIKNIRYNYFKQKTSNDYGEKFLEQDVIISIGEQVLI